jgi:pimeloyl-ACP methyl ester carboxylesterase
VPYVDRGDAQVWWEATGSGPAMLLINGLGSPSTTWFRLLPRLADRYRVVTLDNRGVGRTGLPAGPVTIPSMAADAAAVLEAAGVTSAHVLGMSMGGLIAQELVLSRPDLVRSLVLACTSVGLPHAQALGEQGMPDAGVGEALATGAALPAEERMLQLRPILYAPTTSPERMAEDENVRGATPTSQEGFTAQLLGAQPWERLAELPGINVPTLVLQGSVDRMVPRPQAERLAKTIPGARLRLIDGAGHALFTDQEEASAAAVLDFLEEVENSSVAAVGAER